MSSATSFITLAFLSVVSLRWTATAAQAGPKALTLWLCAAFFFMVPEIAAVSHLSKSSGSEGGLYGWVRNRLGGFHGFMCGWCYWVNNLIYFPSLLLFMVTNVAIAIGIPEPKGMHVVLFTLGALWAIALMSILGASISRQVQRLGMVGNWLPLAVLVALACALLQRTAIDWPTMLIPHDLQASSTDLSLFSSLCFALAGFELVSFYRRDINSQTRLLGVAACLTISVYWIGTLAILIGARSETVTNLNGMVVAISDAAAALGHAWVVLPVGFLMAVAIFSGTFVWFKGAAEIPYLVGVDHYLPQRFSKRHAKHGTPTTAITTQAAFASVLTVMASAGTKLESAYRTLSDICLIVYFVPYLYLFIAHWMAIPKRTVGAVLPILGFTATLLAMVMALFPEGFTVGALALRTLVGSVALIAIGLAFYAGKHRQHNSL